MARITGLLFALAVAGCYNPSLSNPGFYCHADDNPACPDGQKCQDGRCVALDFQGTTGGQDGGVGGGPTGDMSMMSSGDMSSKPADMSKPVDFSQPAPDLSGGGGSCGMQLDPCAADTDCCSGLICFPGFGCI